MMGGFMKRLFFTGIMMILAGVMWIYKGVMYNATSYFFPFQTLNIRKYDFTEFFIYGILVPSIVVGVARLIKGFKTLLSRLN